MLADVLISSLLTSTARSHPVLPERKWHAESAAPGGTVHWAPVGDERRGPVTRRGRARTHEPRGRRRQARRPQVSALCGHEHPVGRRFAPEELLSEDLAFRVRRMAEHGVNGLFEDLWPAVRSERHVLRLRSHCNTPIDVADGELLLMPSVFCASYVVSVVEPGLPTVVVYPARGSAYLAASVIAGVRAELQAFLDEIGLAVLRGLVVPRTLDELVDLIAVHPMRIAGALERLRVDGLIGRRQRGSVFYRRGVGALLNGSRCGGCGTSAAEPAPSFSTATRRSWVW
ncbi:hypothetical protein [Amycolatopsis sp. CA-230715]|uniref:hypothetical protein n=1 Tax=Amycolatopsis sp. CA-230715 TaxID=2745196 RepID=UPI001C021BCE|nr:hypothetical protein [Amycolatopsis sp. CA-230715]QWF84782.1 hypothetical protein HUW46_08234 [Amycolatopsis sp. CA-230715]